MEMHKHKDPAQCRNKIIYYDLTHVVALNNQMVFHGGGYYGLKLLKNIMAYVNKKASFIMLIPEKSICNKTSLFDEVNVECVQVSKLEELHYEEDSILVLPNFNCSSKDNYKMVNKIYDKNRSLKIITFIYDMRFLMDLRFDLYNRYYYPNNGVHAVFGYIREIYHIPKTLIKAILTFRRVREIGKKSEMVITSSNYSFQQLVCYSRLKNAKWYFLNVDIDVPQKKVKNVKPYEFLLFVSGNRREKNLARTLKAYLKSVEAGNMKYPLYITGSADVIQKIIKRMPDINKNLCRSMVHILGFVEESEMQWLYSKCSILLYTSKSEGFGLPACNALLYGRPVLASNRTSIPEVCGASTLYVNPYSVNSIRKGIDALADEINFKILENSAREYSEVLKSMCLFGEKMLIKSVCLKLDRDLVAENFKE